MQCDLELFRNFIKMKHSKKAEDIIKILNSLDDRIKFAQYHYHVYKQSQGEDWYISSRANIVAFMQNLHSAHDILGHLIYYILGLVFVDTKYINFSNVFNKIPEDKYKRLKELLRTLSKHDDFKYLNAYVNHSKHRAIVNPLFNLGIIDVKQCGFSFDEFNKDGTNYSRRQVDEFLANEFNREFKLVIQIENELINILERQPAELK